MAARSGVARGVAWNIVGQGAPLAVAYFAIPVLARGLGVERFGVLTLAWAVLGYVSFFDLGLGRALTQAVSERLGRGDTGAIVSVVRGALWWMLGLGVAGGGLCALAAPRVAARLLGVSPTLVPEARVAFLILAASVPVVILTAGLRGVLEALGRFGAVNGLRVPMGILTFLGPLAVLPFSRGLPAVVAALFAARVAALGAHAAVVRRALGGFPTAGSRMAAAEVRTLLTAGSWMTVTNVVGPLMVSLDRFLIAGIASAATVAYYTAPYEAVTKLWLIPAALTGVLFPAFASSVAGRSDDAARLLGRGIHATLAALLPVVFVVILLAPEGLAAWLGGEYAARSTRVVQVLAAGVLLNSVAQVPFVLVQGAGRARWTALLHLAELPLYLALAGWLIARWGVTGAAVAWTLRAGVDAVAVLALAGRVAPVPAEVFRQLAAAVAACGVAGVATGLDLRARVAVAVVGAAALFVGSLRGLEVGARVGAVRRRLAGG